MMDIALKEINNTNLFTKKEVLDAIQENDTTFEITGYVCSIFQVKSSERNNKRTHLFNFMISNGEVIIQVTAWNELAFKYADLITKTELVYTLQKVVPKIPSKKEFLHNASFPYELLIRNCTILVPIGIYKIPQQIEKIHVTKIEHARAKNGLVIEVIGYVKMIFEKPPKNNFYIGSITDGYHNLPVLITFDGTLENNFTYGSKIKITGRMRVPDNKPPYLSVSSIKDVKLLDNEKMPFLKTLNGYYPIP